MATPINQLSGPEGLNSHHLPNSASEAVARNVASEFPGVIQRLTVCAESAPSSYRSGVSDLLNSLEQNWQQAASARDKLSQSLPANIQPLIEAQVVFNRLQLNSNLISKVGDSISSTIKRVQQMGNG